MVISQVIQEWEFATSRHRNCQNYGRVISRFWLRTLKSKNKMMSTSRKKMVEINKLIGKGEKEEFISQIVFCSKSDGTSWLILYLKTLNEFLVHNP